MPQNKSVIDRRPSDSHEQPESTAAQPLSGRAALLKQSMSHVLSERRAVNDDAPLRVAEGGEVKDPPRDGGRTMPVADVHSKLV